MKKILKGMLMLAACLCLLMPGLVVSAEEYIASGTQTSDTGGTITWSIDSDGKLLVEGDGNVNLIVNENFFGMELPPWMDYRTNIVSAEVNLTNCDSLSYWFLNHVKLKVVDLAGTDISKIKNTAYAFDTCILLEEIIVGNQTWAAVDSYKYMIYECNSLKNIDFRGIELGEEQRDLL